MNDLSTAPAPQRTAVITGAASPRGIGLATARRYARQGWAVAVLDLDADGAVTAAEGIAEEFGVPAQGFRVDVTSQESVQQAAAAVGDSASCRRSAPWPMSRAWPLLSHSSRWASTSGTP